MSLIPTLPEYLQYNDTDGSPLDAGFLYFGAVNQNPETSPITVYWDAAQTQPAAQPIRTLAGVPVRGFSPAMIYPPSNYSITVKNRNSELVYSKASSSDSLFGFLFGIITNLAISFTQGLIGAVTRTLQSKLEDVVSVTDFMTSAEITAYRANNYGGAITTVAAAVQAALDAGVRGIYFPDGTARIDVSLLGRANQFLYGPGVIDTNLKHAAGNQEAIKLLGIDDFTVDGLGFHSAQLVPGETAISMYDTGAAGPCSRVTVRNCRVENIKVIRSEQGEHSAGAGYPYVYYADATKRHKNIIVTGNQIKNLIGAAESVEAESCQLFFCDNVVITNNISDATDGLVFIWGGNHTDANWLAAYRMCKHIVVADNVVNDSNLNAYVLICVEDMVCSDNFANANGHEVLDVEASKDCVISGNRITGGAGALEQFGHCNNMLWEGNIGRTTQPAYATLPFQVANALADPDRINAGGLTVFRGNTLVTPANANGDYAYLGYIKELVFEDNQLLDCGVYHPGSNVACFKNNKWRYTIPATGRLPYEGVYMQADWANSMPAPRLELSGNTVRYSAASFTSIVFYIGQFLANGSVIIDGNELNNGAGDTIRIGGHDGVHGRAISITNNRMPRNPGGYGTLVGTAPYTLDSIYFDNNRTTDGTADVYGALTSGGGETQKFTVDLLPITAGGSKIYNNAPGAATNVGWVCSGPGGAWRPFGVTY